MADVDFMVVGQGIAGSCLAFELLSRGRRIVIIDDSWRDAACLVAAGVVNPITGQRLVRSWRSEVAHPYAKNFYRALEKRLSATFFHDRKILQLCRSSEESGLWRERLSQTGYSEFVGEHGEPRSYPIFDDSFGSYFIERSAWVETRAAMEAFRKFFESRGVLRREKFVLADMKTSGEKIEYRDLKAKKVVFCEGFAVRENPYFSWLPYRPAKGEILRLHTVLELPPHIIHRGNWLMKCGCGEFRIGSTWDRDRIDAVPTDFARSELLAAAKRIFASPCDFEVVGHSAGVRPCTATTRPHLGAHPCDSRVLSFNGMGSKGFALSPYFAKHFADWLDGLCALDSEADLSRHVRKFFRR